jgi:hypothetical protein
MYSENVTPTNGVGTIFDLGNYGTAFSNDYSDIIISGGDIAGCNGGLSVNGINIGNCNQVTIIGAKIERCTNGVVCNSSTTRSNSVFLMCPEFVSVTNLLVNNSGKLNGTYSNAIVAGSRQTNTVATNVIGTNVSPTNLVFPSGLSGTTGTVTTNTMTQYEEGSFTPSFTNLTVVNGTGGATYSGYYKKIGNLVKWIATINVTGTATTAATTSTYISNLPISTASGNHGYDSCTVVNISTAVAIGTGVVIGTQAIMPAWAATNSVITISGSYHTV